MSEGSGSPRRGLTSHLPLEVLFVETTDVSVQSHLRGQLGYLRGQGMNISLLASDTGLLQGILEADDISGTHIRMERDPSPARDARSLVNILRHIRRLAPRTVVYGTPKASLLTSIASWLLRVPNRVYFLYGLRAESMHGVGRFLMVATEKVIVALSTHVISVGEDLIARASSMGIDSRRMRVLGAGSANGVDARRYAIAGASASLRASLRSSNAIPPEAIVVGFVGRLTPDKGLDVLLEALVEVRATFPHLYLVLAGPDEGIGRLRPSTQRQLSEPWVVELGNVVDTAHLYAGMDIFCFPSRREGLPTVLLEASAAGVPIVATNATGVRDVVRDGVTGLVSPVDDVGALRDALLRILDDGAYASALAVEAQRRAICDFDQEVVWESLRDFYLSIQNPAKNKE